MSKTKKINGKIYKNSYIRYTKQNANNMRNRGFITRKIVSNGKARIFIRKRK